MGFGGPVWHASVAHAPKDLARKVALGALGSVGSRLLGQWEEWSGFAYHVRRRLRPEEQEITGPVLDIRGTDEAARRIAANPLLPPDWTE
jgi:hypothetical protein